MQKAKSPKRGPGKAANRKAVLSAQQTIPYLAMHPDGVCKLPGGLYTKTVEYEDINYSVASTEGYGTFRQMAGELARLELEPQPLLGYSVTDPPS